MQCIFAKCNLFEKMKQKAKKVRDYSIEELDALINRIKQSGINGVTDESISKKAGYNEGYIAQTRSRGKVSAKLMEKIKLTYGIGAPTPAGHYEERLIRAEAHLEVLGNTVALILADFDPLSFSGKQADLAKAIEEVVKRRLAELKK
jgi:beta-lactam-binding protein with PASTA domain